MNGTFLGFQQLKTQLSLCPTNYDDVLNMFQFGTVTENSCDYYLDQLVNWNPNNLPEDANNFFELFLLDSN